MNLLKLVFGKLFGFKQWFLKRSFFTKIIIIVLFIVGGWLVLLKMDGSKTQPQYQTSQAEKGTLVTSVSASGTISSGSIVNIATGATGIISQMYIKNGDTVNQGDKIADMVLDQDSLQKQASAWSSYLQAQNSLNSAKSKMNSLQSALFKANQAFINDKGVVDPDTDDPKYIQEKADWLQAEADYNNQAGVISQAEAALNNAALSYQEISSSITAPASGVVTNLTITDGLSITSSTSSSSSTSTNSNTSQTVGTITLQGGRTQAVVNVSEIDVTKIKPGQKVSMTLDAFPSKTFTGRVVIVDTNGQVSSGVTTYPTTITFDTALNNIYPNMAVDTKIITSVKNDVILVPSSAVQTTNGEFTVRVLKNGQITLVSVEIGDSNDTQTEITTGVNEGDTIITSFTTTASGSSSSASPFGGNKGFGGGAVIRTNGR